MAALPEAIARERKLRSPPLAVVVFVVGAASLGTEIAAARLLAPYFGASTTVWANTIATVLVALSLGYWLGGRLADRHPLQRHMSALVLVAAVGLAALAFVARPLPDVALGAPSATSAGAVPPPPPRGAALLA